MDWMKNNKRIKGMSMEMTSDREWKKKTSTNLGQEKIQIYVRFVIVKITIINCGFFGDIQA
jgi:hypothetical protein